jgi:transposase
MSEINTEVVRRLVTGRKSDGRCVYDPEAKAEVVRACMQPGVSVARIAMQVGINANLVRAWIVKTREAERSGRDEPGTSANAGAAFIPLRLEVTQAKPTPTPTPAPALAPAPAPALRAMLRLHVRLPNGVEFDLGEADIDALEPVMHALGGMPCSGSTKR